MMIVDGQALQSVKTKRLLSYNDAMVAFMMMMMMMLYV